MTSIYRPSISYLYFIQVENQPHIKIGISDNVDARLYQLQFANPFKLHVRDILRDKSAFIDSYEEILHKRFAECRGFGEWFNISLTELRDAADAMGFVRIEIPDHLSVKDVLDGMGDIAIAGAKFHPWKERPLDAR